jgi:hypothetical protein
MPRRACPDRKQAAAEKHQGEIASTVEPNDPHLITIDDPKRDEDDDRPRQRNYREQMHPIRGDNA